MISRAVKLRFRRRFRMRRKQVEEISQQAGDQLERNFFRRLERLAGVRRFVAVWLILILLLGGSVTAQLSALRGYYQEPGPVPGGTYTEGILGSFTDASPLFATSATDMAVSSLLFNGLLTYDNRNNLVGELAKDWSVDDRGTTYTVHLKPHLMWHDGQPLTAADVAFTYQVIQNPDARSPLGPSWSGVTVKAVDAQTVTFTLPSVLSSFPYSLTNGIVPKHILAGKSMPSLRSLPFNTIEPVGSGPFKFSTLEVTGGSPQSRQEIIALDPFDGYQGGTPKLSRFVVRTFRTPERMISSFNKREVTAISGLTQVPKSLANDDSVRAYNLPISAAVMTFFRMSSGVLADRTVRQALTTATDRSAIIDSLGYATMPVREPLLQNQVGYDQTLVQPSYDPAAAKAQLDAGGWLVGKNGIRVKDNIPLSFDLYAQSDSEYATVAHMLRDQWRQIGVRVNVKTQDQIEFQSTLTDHSYEALLYGISIGKDPDVLVYWDSKYADANADRRLNFSEYKSPIADAALESGRTRSDVALRTIKYRPFLQAWHDDYPAVGLYQPRYLYITHGIVHGLDEHTINAVVERFTNVQNWMIKEKGVSQLAL